MEEKITKYVEHLLTILDFTDATVSVQEDVSSDAGAQRAKRFMCNITMPSDSRFLIGQHGVNLDALQHIVNALMRKEKDLYAYVVVDINNYRSEKNMMTARVAQEAAEKARREKKPVILRPMSAYERRIIHTTLADNSDVTTESIGERDERKVVVTATGII